MLTSIAEHVLVHQSEFIMSNSVVVRGASGPLLIDPGITTSELTDIATDVRALGRPIVAGFSTHAHWDHLLWDAAFGEPPRYGTARGAADIAAFLSNPAWRDAIAGQLPPDLDVPLDLLGAIRGMPEGTEFVPWDGPAVRILAHGAHAASHASLLIEDSGVLVAGDMLSDFLVPMLDQRSSDPIDEYLAGLDLLESAVDRVTVIVPGHGSVGDARDARERLVLDRAYLLALRSGDAPDDPRLGASAKPGWEWVSDVHAGQRKALAQRN
jgi:glyoxylase-like metal-dependent hydrolase (beta-lactamase superfamily II)